MNNILPLVYLLVLLGSLSIVTIVIGKEIIKKRQIELQLAELQN